VKLVHLFVFITKKQEHCDGVVAVTDELLALSVYFFFGRGHPVVFKVHQ
jgi:hypothetical protein